MSLDDSPRTTNVFKRGDILAIHSTGMSPSHPVFLRVLAVDTLGIIGNVAITPHYPPLKEDGDGDYLDTDDTHATVYPWSTVRSATRVQDDRSYEALWNGAEARWKAARA